MTGKLRLLIGFAVGYVLGARSGRQRYDQIVDKAQSLWHDPRVRAKVSRARHVVQDKAGEAFDHMGSDDDSNGTTPAEQRFEGEGGRLA